MALTGLYICAVSLERTVHPKAFIGLLCLFLFWAHIGGLAGFGQTKDFFPFSVLVCISLSFTHLFLFLVLERI